MFLRPNTLDIFWISSPLTYSRVGITLENFSSLQSLLNHQFFTLYWFISILKQANNKNQIPCLDSSSLYIHPLSLFSFIAYLFERDI